jgi:dolichol-phosphate mannosyltransferase
MEMQGKWPRNWTRGPAYAGIEEIPHMPSETLSSTRTFEGLLPVPSGELVVRGVPARGRLAFSLVVPTLNESRNVKELIALLKSAIASKVGESYEIIVVDDDSPDRTWRVAADMALRDEHVLAMRRTTERGLATAVVRGWQAARGNLLGVIDADLQHPPEVTAQLIAAMLDGADLAVASREAEGGGTSDWSFVRLLISRGSRALGRLLLPGVLGMVTDPMTGFFVVRRTAIEDVVLAPCGYKILVELLVRSRVKTIVEVGYVFRSRQRGESKASLKVFVEYVQHLLRLRACACGPSPKPSTTELESKVAAAGRE